MKISNPIVGYNNEWPRLFEEEKQKITIALASQIIQIHHIGSTAVPGLSAKPEIDIYIEIKDIGDYHLFEKALISLGYRARGECLDNLGTEGRFYFSKDIDGTRTHKVHVSETGHPEILKKIAFRDYLIEHPNVMIEYENLKKSLAAEETGGTYEYLTGKSEFIQKITKLAVVHYRKELGASNI